MKLEEIAKLAGVSRTTASYVINGKSAQYRISEKTQKKVMAVVEKYNYQPNYAASSLRAGNSRTFGLVIPDLENTSYAKLAKLLERDARKAGFQLIIACSDDDPDTEMSVVTSLVSRRIDVLLVASALPADNDFYKTIQEKKGVPVVAIDRYLNDEFFPSVISEDLDGALELSQSLLEKNVSSIGLIGAFPQLGISKEREQGFKAALAQQTNQPEVIYAYGENFSVEQGRYLAQKWIDQGCFPDAVLVTSYALFEGVLDCLLAHPQLLQKVALATFGNNRLLDFLPVKIQSLSQQFEIIAEKALQLALSAAKGKHETSIDVIPRKLVKR